MEIEFYKSRFCPRCILAERVLDEMVKENPGIQVLKIDVLTDRKRAKAAGVKMVPTLKFGEEQMAGFLLSRSRIGKFLASLKEQEKKRETEKDRMVRAMEKITSGKVIVTREKSDLSDGFGWDETEEEYQKRQAQWLKETS